MLPYSEQGRPIMWKKHPAYKSDTKQSIGGSILHCYNYSETQADL